MRIGVDEWAIHFDLLPAWSASASTNSLFGRKTGVWFPDHVDRLSDYLQAETSPRPGDAFAFQAAFWARVNLTGGCGAEPSSPLFLTG